MRVRVRGHPPSSSRDRHPRVAGRRRPPASSGSVREAIRRIWLEEPPWLVRDGVVALIIGLLLLVSQLWFDVAQIHRQETLENARSEHAEQLENLRFVRERSSPRRLGRPFQEFNLHGQNLIGLQLAGADFTGSNLGDASLTLSNLRGADFSSADLSYARVNLADLRNAQFGEADLRGAAVNSVLRHAHLRDADLSRANLLSADFTDAFLVDANLTEANLAESVLVRADLSGADLTGADLTKVDLTGAKLTGATLFDICYSDATKWPKGVRVPDTSSHCTDVAHID